MSCSLHLPSGSRYAETEATPAWVTDENNPEIALDLTYAFSRFMSDKIMPMSEALEGYELFDKMKVQKGKPR